MVSPFRGDGREVYHRWSRQAIYPQDRGTRPEFEVNAWKIAGEGGLRRAFTVLYLGLSAYQALSNVKDKAQREQLRGYFDHAPTRAWWM